MKIVADSTTTAPGRFSDASSGFASTVRRKGRAWRRRPAEEKAWVAPAFILLGLSRAALLTVPFRRIAPLLGHDLRTAPAVPLAHSDEVARALHVGRAVRTAARYTPWQSKCLAQAITARVLLGVSRLPYGLYLGVERDAVAGMVAHAWVCSGRASVTGGDGFERFTVVAAFVSGRPGTTW